MPPQHVEIAETIIALKRALRREKEAPSDQPISSATNRGNKLKRGATYVHAGSLPYRYSAHGYKERIEHAGYQRYILDRNPKRYNEYGDELDESESDEDADADADDENPYSDIRIEELLRPLTHPAELSTHPTLNLAYLDTALPDMVQSTEAQLRQERANLWRAKNLHRQFIGDESWMPCESVEASDDWDLFEPHRSVADSSSGKKRKRNDNEQILENGVQRHDHAKPISSAASTMNGVKLTNGINKTQESATITEGSEQQSKSDGDEVVKDKEANEQTTDTREDIDMVDRQEPDFNGAHQERDEPTEKDKPAEDSIQNPNQETDDTLVDEQNDPSNQSNTEGTPPPPTRRITRALAAADTSNAPTPPLSPTPSTLSSLSSSLLQPAGLFLLPTSLTLSHSTHPTSHLPLHVAHSGLPIDEIMETRRLLGMYIQKQEETIRGLEGVLGKLIKAKRMKDRIWEWCKAEGHVGEWSDGEDWVDAEAWGLGPEELRKGRDEEEQEVQEEGRKGKRRRGRE